MTVGASFIEPLAGNVPTPLMLTELALLAFQLSSVAAPLVTALGWALSAIVGACPEVLDAPIDPPPHPMLAIKIENKNTNADMRRTNRIETSSWTQISGEATDLDSWVSLDSKQLRSDSQAKAQK